MLLLNLPNQESFEEVDKRRFIMPQEIEGKLIWLFILLPGFLSTSIIGQIVDLGQLTEFQVTFYSLVLTLINLSIALPLYWVIGRLRGHKPAGKFNTAAFCSIILIISILTGIIIGFAAEKDIFFVTLRALPITKTLNKRSSSRPLVFLLSQNSTGKLKEEGDARPKEMKKTEAWLKVKLKSGRQYEGWPEFHEIGSKPTELYLSPACEWCEHRGKKILKPISGPGIIIYEREIETITFIDREKSECFEYWLGGESIGVKNREK
jgi:hypothetical protein